MLSYLTKHRAFRSCHTPKYVENPEGQTAVISTIFLLQHGHNAILSHKTQGFRILSQARLARANAMMVRYNCSVKEPKTLLYLL